MIDELVVRNLGVIEEARIRPGPGLTVITGETGTGKTLLLGALRLLLGGEARADLVGPFADEASAEGRFYPTGGGEIGASRRLPRDGRSRAYLDGSISSARALEEAVAGLVDVVAQHDHVALTRPAEIRTLVDGALDEDGRGAAVRYAEAWEGLVAATGDRDRLGGDVSALVRELDLVTYQADEIERAGLTPDEDVQLQHRADRLRNAEEIGSLLASGRSHVQDGREALGEAVAALRRAASLDESLEEIAAAVEDHAAVLDDLALDVARAVEETEADPTELETVESRLTTIGDLRRKYGTTVEDILAFGRRAQARRTELESLLERAHAIDDEVAAARDRVVAEGRRLTEARERAAVALAETARTHLLDLGFSDPHLSFDVEQVEPSRSGADRIDLRFASDARLAPGPVSKVASGGELSRLVLALRLSGGAGDADTLVFDEVDAGVGGSTALALGEKLAGLARDRQVLCVTHLPQVAAFADRHYVVTRRDTTGTVAPVEGSERVEELARMLAGLPESVRGREAAEELLETAAGR